MKLLYKQPDADSGASGLTQIGVERCYLKYLYLLRDRKEIFRKSHRHADFEIHMVTAGYQVYQVAGQQYRIEAGQYLIIPPNTPHTAIDFHSQTQKFAFTFRCHGEDLPRCCTGTLTPRLTDHLLFIAAQAKQPGPMSAILTENCIFEILVTLLPCAAVPPQASQPQGNAVAELAKQYIEDNISHAPDVREVADYCGISTKQLTRVFTDSGLSAPGEYIKLRRLRKAERLLADSSLSLKEISEALCFSSEYYFNTFIRKNTGMPPGEYRKMLGK